ncbi:MAG: hypothetical protein KY456_10900 [Chloroflexi bacterium]|nr:hypothetical protein [Chloroflexota bacterium]
MDWGSALVAGVVATAVMTILMYLGKAMGMPMDMPRMLGLMFVRPHSSSLVYVLGLMVHFMMGVVFAVVYALLFDALGIDPSWLWGALFGAVHGVIAGMAFGMMPAMHPRMGNGDELPAPGLFGRNLGSMVPVAIIVVHVVFGGVYTRLVA